jgi:ArsR family transcriptional regulator, arsenate/arsenite/antimonite-responsive transcriptional repressor / arsenate reductase (thioredoxin)
MSAERDWDVRLRALRALADPVRLAVVDALVSADVSPGRLAADLHAPGNLLAHHLKVLESAGIVRRVRSEADRRRHYVQLVPGSLDGLMPGSPTRRVASRVVFVCTHNSARSQLAAAVWRTRSEVPVASAGTRPAERVNPGAVAAARRHGLRLGCARPVHVEQVLQPPDLVVSVCDAAHEELEGTGREHLHWSVPDPVRLSTDEAFEQAYEMVAGRVVRLAQTVTTNGEAA